MLNIEIYQVNCKSEICGKKHGDSCLFKFEALDRIDLDFLEKSCYTKVYDYDRNGDISADEDYYIELEKIFMKFNMERPKDFKGHSLSVSDIVLVDGKAFYCDSMGFEPIDWF